MAFPKFCRICEGAIDRSTTYSDGSSKLLYCCGTCRAMGMKRGEEARSRLMHQQRLDGKPDDLVSVDRRGEIKPATARERQLRLF